MMRALAVVGLLSTSLCGSVWAQTDRPDPIPLSDVLPADDLPEPERDAAAATDDVIPTPRPEIPASTPGWEVCNETSFVLRLAVATMRVDRLEPRGWDRLRPGQCRRIAAAEGTPRYVFAESDSIHLGGIREWKGDYQLCAGSEDFSANTVQSCALQGLEERRYLRIDPDEARTALVEPENFADKAVTAGLQRLLRDAGYSVRRIDGLSGRRTRRTIRRFLKDEGLSGVDTPEAQIDALSRAAARRRAELGVTVCNRSSQRIWTAIGYVEDERWESRGWWPTEAETCVQTFSQPLKDRSAHIFALQENPDPDGDGQDMRPDRRLRVSATAPSQFCIAEARFAATGREYCADRGYTAVNFRALPNDQDGVSLDLTDADFAEATAGLRR